MNIGKLSIGVRDTIFNYNNWKQYITPKETQGKSHPYFKFGIWWLWFYMYYPKKCPICKEWMPTNGGIQQYNSDGEFIRVVCRNYNKLNYK